MRETRESGRPVVRHRTRAFHALSVPILDEGWEDAVEALFEGWARHGRMLGREDQPWSD
jgi:hypothetical protein